MYATQKTKMKPAERIQLALEAASKFNGGVAAPFLIIDQLKSKKK